MILSHKEQLTTLSIPNDKFLRDVHKFLKDTLLPFVIGVGEFDICDEFDGSLRSVIIRSDRKISIQNISMIKYLVIGFWAGWLTKKE